MPSTKRTLHFTLYLLSILLISCSSHRVPAYLDQAKMSYAQHDYPRAFEELLKTPLTNPEAQYALGYMYYYGLGIAKDEDRGRFWIRKAADQCYIPAMQALHKITTVYESQYWPLEKRKVVGMSYAKKRLKTYRDYL